jgi:hypothetical protein
MTCLRSAVVWQTVRRYASRRASHREVLDVMRKVLAVLALLCAAVALAPSAQAATNGGGGDYAGNCELTVSPTQFGPDSDVNISGRGFAANFTTELHLINNSTGQNRVLGSVTTDGNGAFGPRSFHIPADSAPGSYTISAACDSAGVTVNSGVTVAGTTVTQGGGSGSGGVGGTGLSRTGTDTTPYVAVATILILAGAVFLLVARRRRATVLAD